MYHSPDCRTPRRLEALNAELSTPKSMLNFLPRNRCSTFHPEIDAQLSTPKSMLNFPPRNRCSTFHPEIDAQLSTPKSMLNFPPRNSAQLSPAIKSLEHMEILDISRNFFETLESISDCAIHWKCLTKIIASECSISSIPGKA
jgi:hypothetical protein